ncbi:cytochrome P450 [Kitasatospora sp. NPDC056076]|uniref:cytochrome P450 n=1 Tax=unclassified Kitasatospora TaxID=2633591 RepID=UPI0035DA9553
MSEERPTIAYPVVRTDPARPPEEYARLRREQPVCPITLATGDPAYLVTRYEDVRTVLSDRRFSRALMLEPDAPRFQAAAPSPDVILNMDPPRHTRVRKFAAQAFTTRRVDELRPRMETVIGEVLDEMAAGPRPADLNEAFGRPVPLRIVCEMLGVPLADQDRFVGWTERMMSLRDFPAAEVRQAYLDMRAYFSDLVDHKRADPGDDLLSALTTFSDAEGPLTQAELVGLGTALLVAGHDTSVTVFASAVLTLLRHPEQLAELRKDRSLWPAAVEELLRLDNPGGVISPRRAGTDIALGDVVIPAGAAVMQHIGSACRDETVFRDPERFDIHRTESTQLFFGHGPHFCIGAPLARAEMEIGLRMLFERFPDLELAVDLQALKWRDFAALGGYTEFPVTWA